MVVVLVVVYHSLVATDAAGESSACRDTHWLGTYIQFLTLAIFVTIRQ